MPTQSSLSRRAASRRCGISPLVLAGVAALALAILVVGARSSSAALPTGDAARAVYFPAKLKVMRAVVRNGTLDALFSLTGRATGVITVDYQAAGQFRRVLVNVGPPKEGEKRVAVVLLLVGRQSETHTGIINAAFAGNDTVQADRVRVRAANGRSGLTLKRLTFADTRLSVDGSIDGRLSGIVRLRVTYIDSDGSVGVWTGRAAIARAAWALDEKLPAPAAADPNAYLTMQFTGQKDAPGGPYRGEQIGKSLGNLAGMPSHSSGEADHQQDSRVEDTCGGTDEDACSNRNEE